MKKSLFTAFLFFTICNHLKSQNVDQSEFAIFSTIKIESQTRIVINKLERKSTSTGTGFFFQFTTPKGIVPVIVTNKHVVKDASSGVLYFKSNLKDQFTGMYKVEKVELSDFSSKWINHPDTSVDLAILPIAPILKFYNQKGVEFIFSTYTENNIPNDSVKNSLTAIEDILMIGYPYGLRDLANDLPVVRRGITATPAYLDYNSKKEFLCDLSVYPGSSGSPIIIYNSTSYSDRKGNSYFGNRLILLGVNYATYTKNFEGKIIPKISYDIQDSLKVNVAIPYNIGIIIKSERILDFRKYFN